MDSSVYKYNGKSRDLRKVILALLKSWLAIEVQKMNYIHNYIMKDNKLFKWETQIFIVYSNDLEKVNDFLLRNFSQVERVNLK